VQGELGEMIQAGGGVAEIEASSDTRKKAGEQVEAKFLEKVTAMGLSVAKPWGDSDRYDLIVDSGRHLWRVQVKSTRYAGEKRFSVASRGCTDAYTEDEIDFLAAYIVPLDVWYLIPVKAIAGRRFLRFYPEGKNSAGRYEKYQGALWQLKE